MVLAERTITEKPRRHETIGVSFVQTHQRLGAVKGTECRGDGLVNVWMESSQDLDSQNLSYSCHACAADLTSGQIVR